MPRGDDSTAGVWRSDSEGVRRPAAGVAEARRLAARAAVGAGSDLDSSTGSGGGAVDLRDTGLETGGGGGGGDSSVFGATESRAVLVASEVAGVEDSGVLGDAGAVTVNFRGILIVPALG